MLYINVDNKHEITNVPIYEQKAVLQHVTIRKPRPLLEYLPRLKLVFETTRCRVKELDWVKERYVRQQDEAADFAHILLMDILW